MPCPQTHITYKHLTKTDDKTCYTVYATSLSTVKPCITGPTCHMLHQMTYNEVTSSKPHFSQKVRNKLQHAAESQHICIYMFHHP